MKIRITQITTAIVLMIALVACSADQLTTFKTGASIGVSTLKSIRDSEKILVAQGKATQANVDVLNIIIDKIDPVNGEIQTLTAWPPADKKALYDTLVDFTKTGAQIAASSGLSPQVVLAIQVSVGVFEGLSSQIASPVVNGALTVPASPDSIKAKLKKLKDIDKELKIESATK